MSEVSGEPYTDAQGSNGNRNRSMDVESETNEIKDQTEQLDRSQQLVLMPQRASAQARRICVRL